MRVLITCQLHQVNQRDFVSALASSDSFDSELLVMTDSRNYPDVGGVDQQQIHHYAPLQPRQFSRVNPYDIVRFRRVISRLSPDILLSLGVSDLRFLATTTGFNPSVLLPQGSETELATHQVSPFRDFNTWVSSVAYKRLFSELLGHVDEIWTSEPSYSIYSELGAEEHQFKHFDWDVVDTDRFSPQDSAVSYVEDENITVFGSFRRLRGERLIPTFGCFFDAVENLSQYRDDFYIVIGGFYPEREDSPVAKYVKRRVKESGLEDSVTLLDMVDKEDLPSYYSGLDVYLNFTHVGHPLAGIGSAAKEAASCGCALVSFNSPPVDYFINHGENGILANHDDPDELAKSLEKLCKDPTFRNRLGEQGRKSIEQNFSLEAVASNVAARCQKLCDHNQV